MKGHTPMDITDEMVTAYRRAEAHAESAPGEPLINDVMRAGLAAVAPLIAAQALRQAAEEIESGITENPTEDRAVDSYNLALEVCAQIARRLAGRERSQPEVDVEAVGMVCQTCGTYYAPTTP